ncbi:CoA transferase [Edwardsiella ictaluri]|uniref:CAIB/BAIF family protein n=1 Tax=Edwardsiella ictaluri (strain 93-146) TaxID=634503 RepID=C5BD64_EDWI9|nr:CoA transferase [Edwardsiella ictaluri]ACR68559.1 CAIB/BAIF family protein [Edwardsiella ictaluri 93-146]ARD38054.1 CoA transferase [Edwardsiella ictaluri]AVZ81128.1 CoA transferase [Edwardsiella ictaluri]EKS7763158.1 CoA transferase [Edwardsiella ictaluri]EKS7764925.1 CoA transferase [Edwardsiella ictaluri]
MEQTLAGIVVLDLTRVLAGPFCSMLLADMGAEVIKIELPGKGDDSRSFAPFVNGESAYYMNLNRNKQGMTLNLKSEQGRALFLRLVARADIVLENFRPGTMEKLALGYEQLRQVNPRLVYGCVSGFGHYGPYAARAGYDIIGQAMGGMMSTTGWPDGEPTRCGTAIADVLAGLFMSTGVLAACHSAQRTGEGQKVDVALVDSVVAGMEIINQIYLVDGIVPGRNGNRYESIYPYDSFRCLDGTLVIGAGNDKLYHALCHLMAQPELIDDPRFVTNPLRIRHSAALKAIVERWLADQMMDRAIERLLAVGIPAGPINTIDRVVQDPHIAGARQMFVDMQHPRAGKVTITGNPIKLSADEYRAPQASPALGEHSLAILQKHLGIDAEMFQALQREGVL